MEKMIYAILSVKRDHGKLVASLAAIKGIAGADLFALSFDEITAVVSHITRVNLIADRSNAIEYDGVIEALAQQFTLLPMRFGSMMETADAITKMLERNYQEIQQNLQKVENKVEFGLKIFCDSEKLRAELKTKSEADIQTYVKPATKIKNSIYRDYVDKKLKEHRLEELILTYADSVIAEITEHLTRLNALNKIKKMATASNIIDAVFLLDKDAKSELIQVIENLQNQHHGLNFVLTGPWPPYNFVNFTVK